ncbi:GGDEF domain-containing protein, partial [Arcobacter sp. CECT 8985]|uniref:GGDEF domain-containing protein n=1 Tax=Arcobacter sp. CECT 8985 TaxID=1935424 RepID=UPI001025F136
DNNYLFSIELSNKATLTKEGKNTIFIFILIVIIFLIVLFYITYLYHNIVKDQNNQLEEKVEARTLQIRSTLKELEKVNLKLYDLAHTDFLTKTMNRRHFFMHAQNAYKTAIEKEEELSVVMIDIDNFKKLNDSYGHDLGDRVLVSFSKSIKDAIGKETIFGRLGGEEFAIIFKNTNLKEAIIKTNEIRNNIEKLEIATKNNTIKITASFGVSDRKNAHSIDEMLKKADIHLYHAKSCGKNIVRSRLNLI